MRTRPNARRTKLAALVARPAGWINIRAASASGVWRSRWLSRLRALSLRVAGRTAPVASKTTHSVPGEVSGDDHCSQPGAAAPRSAPSERGSRSCSNEWSALGATTPVARVVGAVRSTACSTALSPPALSPSGSPHGARRSERGGVPRRDPRRSGAGARGPGCGGG